MESKLSLHLHFCLLLQVSNNLSGVENVLPSKRLADGSKRVGVPHFLSAQVKNKDDFCLYSNHPIA